MRRIAQPSKLLTHTRPELTRALCASRVPDRNLGLGRESNRPPRPNLAWFTAGRRWPSDGSPFISCNQNRLAGSPNPKLSLLFLPFSLFTAWHPKMMERRPFASAKGGARRRRGPPRRSARSPLGDRGAIEWPRVSAFSPHAGDLTSCSDSRYSGHAMAGHLPARWRLRRQGRSLGRLVPISVLTFLG